eukprot:Clim_evm31s22 gene=Clim_evmTU31s22
MFRVLGSPSPLLTPSGMGTALARRSFTDGQRKPDDYQCAVIQGASRGIGLTWVKHLLQRDCPKVYATCRNIEGSRGLKHLQLAYADRLTVLQLDLTDEDSILQAAKAVKANHKETTIRKLSARGALNTYAINTVGPMLVLKHFLPLLTAGKNLSVSASISARVGSISDNGIGGWYSYRASKAALNQMNKCLAVEVGRNKKSLCTIVLHPGTVDTDLSAPYQKGVPEGKVFTKEYSVDQMMKICNAVDEEDSGKFYAWDGKEVPY